MRDIMIVVGFVALFVLAGLMVNRAFTLSAENQIGMATSTFALSSSAFANDGSIPAHNTCDGASASPPLSISNAPLGTKSFALIVEDPDVPKQLKPDGVFLHWVLFNIPASVTEITEGWSPPAGGGVTGANGAGKAAYAGPCPPPQYEPRTHRYVFTVYALDTELSLKSGAAKGAVVKAMDGHIIGQAQLIGTYKRK